MLVEKIVKEWVLSDEDKQVIRNNAKKIKNYFASLQMDTCKDFFTDYCTSDDEFLNFILDYLPFVEEGRSYMSEDDIHDLVEEIEKAIKGIKTSLTIEDFAEEDDAMGFIREKYDIDSLIEELFKYGDEDFINELLNG